jgi:hypothetical protein
MSRLSHSLDDFWRAHGLSEVTLAMITSPSSRKTEPSLMGNDDVFDQVTPP